MEEPHIDPIVLITSKDPKNNNFGTGFVIHQDDYSSYILTCAHVIKDLGGPSQVVVGSYLAELVIKDIDNEFDLAVLRLNGWREAAPLKLRISGFRNMQFIVKGYGFHDSATQYVARPLRGRLGEKVVLTTRSFARRVVAWDLKIEDEFSGLRDGYSGSPVIDESNNTVFAVASHGQVDGKKGNAISVSGLTTIWKDMPKHLLIDSRDEINTDSLLYSYKNDVFLSYRDDFSGPWIRDYFLPLFKWTLEDVLGRQPEIFVATLKDDGLLSRSRKEELVRSRILVPIWSPSYFNLTWSIYECSVFLSRESQLGYRTEKNEVNLLKPVVVCDGTSFPEFAQNISFFNCRNYMIPVAAFGRTDAYIEFSNDMRNWATNVAAAMDLAPECREEWLDLEVSSFPTKESIICPLPVLG